MKILLLKTERTWHSQRECFLLSMSDDLKKQVQELTLALLYVNRFREKEDDSWRSWKGYDFDDLNALSEKGLIIDGRRAKSVTLSEEGCKEAKKMLKKFEITDDV